MAALALAAGGCGSSDDEDSGSSGTSELPQGSEPVELDPADFTTEIDNPYWPMKPGTRWTYGETDEEGQAARGGRDRDQRDEGDRQRGRRPAWCATR